MSRIIGPRGAAREVYEAVSALLAAAGLKPGPLNRSGKHYKLPVEINSRQHTIIIPVSPSDPNAVNIKLGDVRRLLRREGVLA